MSEINVELKRQLRINMRELNKRENSRYFQLQKQIIQKQQASKALSYLLISNLITKMPSFSPESSHLSAKSSGIQSECVAKSSQKRSICQQQIISQNYNQQFEDDELYNEQSSLPLCMKEYYINEKGLNRLSSKEQVKQDDDQQLQSGISQASDYESDKIQPTTYEVQVLDRQTMQYQSTVEERNRILSLELQNQKIKNLHFQKMLSILIDEDNIQRQKLTKMSQFYREKYQQFSEIQQENQRLKLKTQQLQKQVQHYKDLIYIANHNYELIEKKLQQTKYQVVSLQVQKQQRQKGFHQKLQNLKLVMKSLMSNLKAHENLSPTTDRNYQPTTRLQHTSCQGLYSFGDQQINFREKKQRIPQRQLVFNSVQNKLKPPKQLVSQRTQSSKQGVTVRRKQLEKENVLTTQRGGEEDRNYVCNKSATFAKLKSPKNVTVQENYRKLFMKTLVSSSQMPKSNN